MVFGRKKSKSARSSASPPRQEEEPPPKVEQETSSSSGPVQENLRWNIDHVVADRICNFNRHSAEHSGYFLKTTFLDEVKQQQQQRELYFYDSNTGNLLFVAPRGRSLDDFLQESRTLGWLSFRQEEVQWDAVRVLQDGQVLSIDGTHLGHDLPDAGGPRYSINIMSIAGSPEHI